MKPKDGGGSAVNGVNRVNGERHCVGRTKPHGAVAVSSYVAVHVVYPYVAVAVEPAVQCAVQCVVQCVRGIGMGDGNRPLGKRLYILGLLLG